VAKDRSPVRASDIGAWTFCHRAWWLAQVQGATHQHPADRARGDASHRRHGRLLVRAQRLRRAGLICLAAGILLLLLVIGLWMLPGG